MLFIPKFSNAKQPLGTPTITTVPFQENSPVIQESSFIHRPLELDTIFKNTTIEIRQLLTVDRVAIFKFYPDTHWDGKFIAEDVAAGYPSALAAQDYEHFED